MKDRHGSLENEILNVVWQLEEALRSEDTDISVNKIYQIMNEQNTTRAYTTIKTVMDRLVEKNILKRAKIGKKFCYSSTSSRTQMASKAIQKLAHQYFHDDIRQLMRAIEKESLQVTY